MIFIHAQNYPELTQSAAPHACSTGVPSSAGGVIHCSHILCCPANSAPIIVLVPHRTKKRASHSPLPVMIPVPSVPASSRQRRQSCYPGPCHRDGCISGAHARVLCFGQGAKTDLTATLPTKWLNNSSSLCCICAAFWTKVVSSLNRGPETWPAPPCRDWPTNRHPAPAPQHKPT